MVHAFPPIFLKNKTKDCRLSSNHRFQIVSKHQAWTKEMFLLVLIIILVNFRQNKWYQVEDKILDDIVSIHLVHQDSVHTPLMTMVVHTFSRPLYMLLY